MKKLFLITMIGTFLGCSDQNNKSFHYPQINVIYPQTNEIDHVDQYFGTEVKDPYRWLEDDMSAATAQWVKAENGVTFGYLDEIPFRDKIKSRLEKLWDYEKLGAPKKHGDYYYFYKNSGVQNQNVLYRKANLDDEDAEVFIDPNKFSADGTISLSGTAFTKDGSLIAYKISESGSDWNKIIVKETENGTIVGDTIKDVKFSGIAWKGNEGFFYSSYDKPKDGSILSGKTQYHKLFYHKLGTPQREDVLILGGEDMPRRYIHAGITEDQKYLIIDAAENTYGNELYIKDLSKDDNPIIPIISGFDYENQVVDNDAGRLFIETNLNAPNKKVIVADVSALGPENWQDLIPETENPLEATSAGGYLFASYMVDVKSKVEQYELSGKLVRVLELPGIGTAGGFSGEKTDENLFYSFTSFTIPSSIYKYDINSGSSELYWKPIIDFNSDDFETEQVFYESKDGTKVPMFITYKKGLVKDGNNPCYLYAYGGFNVSETPQFSLSVTVLLENGGIFAQPNIRGGGEYGEKWHEAGTKMKKQNVFDDFIAAAEYLKANKYTSTEKLAIAGGSNGGLLVGATITQRPDIAAVAFPAVGVLDMLRYHKFTSGAGWASDYGNADQSKEMFEYLLAYSPVHNVKPAEYPATLITTGDHDDRVVPAHSFKFAAELQKNQLGDKPVLIRIETKAGHGAGKPTTKIIEEVADKWAFFFYNTNSPVSYD